MRGGRWGGGGGGNARQRVASEACKCEALPPRGSKLRLLIATGNAKNCSFYMCAICAIIPLEQFLCKCLSICNATATCCSNFFLQKKIKGSVLRTLPHSKELSFSLTFYFPFIRCNRKGKYVFKNKLVFGFFSNLKLLGIP